MKMSVKMCMKIRIIFSTFQIQDIHMNFITIKYYVTTVNHTGFAECNTNDLSLPASNSTTESRTTLKQIVHEKSIYAHTSAASAVVSVVRLSASVFKVHTRVAVAVTT